MLKKQLILTILLFNIPLWASQINSNIEYGAIKFENAKIDFDNELIKQSDLKLMELVKSYSYSPALDQSILLQSEIDYLNGNFKLAETKLSDFISLRKNSPFVPFAALKRAFIVFQQGKFEQSEQYFEIAYKLSMNDFSARQDSNYYFLAHESKYWEAIAISQQGRHLDALPVFQTTYLNFPDGKYADDALFGIGRIFEINSKSDSAIYYYRNLNQKYPFSNTYVASLIRESNNCIILKQPSSALISLEKASNALNHIKLADSIGQKYERQSFTENSMEKIIYLQGESYNILGNFEKSTTLLNDFLVQYPNSDLINFVRLADGWAYMNLGKYPDALLLYNEIIDNSTEETYKLKAIAQLYRAVALKKDEQTIQAQKELTMLSVQSSYPFMGLVLLELGQMYYENEEFENAKKTLERAILENVSANISVRIHLLLGASYLELKSWDKGIKEYKIAEKLAKNSNYINMPNKDWYISESKFKQGIALLQTQRSNEAIPNLIEFIANNNNDINRLEEAIFWLAESYYRSDLLQNAIENYNKVIENYPSSKRREECLYGLGWSYFRLKNFKMSSATFDKLITEFPKTKFGVEVLTRQGDGYYIEKQFSQAAESYRKAAKLSPGSEEGQYASYQLCHALYRLGANEQAISSLLDYVRVYPKASFAPNALYLIGWIRFQEKKYGEAIDNFNFLLSSYPQSSLVPRTYYAIGDAYYNLGKYNESIASYKNVIELYPNSDLAPEAIKSIQYALMATGRESEAIEIANKYVQANPDSPFAPEFQKKMGEMFYQGRKYQDAVTEYEKFLANHPNNENIPEVMYWMSKSYVSLNEFDKAEKSFNLLSEKYPESEFAPMAMLETGLLNIEKADIEKAEAIFNKMVEKYPNNTNSAQAGFETAVLKFRKGDTLQAIQAFEKVCKLFPNTDYSDQSRYRIAMYYRAINANDSARNNFKLITNIEDNPNISSEALYRIGELYLRDGNNEKAIETFIEVKNKFEGFEDWYSLSLLSLGEAYENIQNFEAAKEIYTVLENLRLNDDFGKTAKSRLKRLKK